MSATLNGYYMLYNLVEKNIVIITFVISTVYINPLYLCGSAMRPLPPLCPISVTLY